MYSDLNRQSTIENRKSTRYDAILPAGGRLAGPFAQEAGTEIKALIRFGEQTILRRTIEALRATGRAGRIVVVGDEEVRAEAHRCDAEADLAAGATGPENILRGLDWLHAQPGGPTPHLLTVTTDLPFLTADAVNAYLDRCPPEADIAVPIVTQQAFEARFPGTDSTFVQLRDGAFTLGGVMRMDARTLRRSRPHLDLLFTARKSQWQMALLVGPGIAWRLLTRSLTVNHIVTRANTVLGCSGVPVLDAPAELAYDIDLPSEYAYACRHLYSSGSDDFAARMQDGKEIVG